jgi:hypothetical protein
MEKPKNEWAHELSGILNKAGYTVIKYESKSFNCRSTGTTISLSKNYPPTASLNLLSNNFASSPNSRTSSATFS